MSNKRDISIELYRVLLMLGICLLHAIGNSAEPKTWLCNILASCVVGFVFISGWFGIKFTWAKLVKLYGIGLYCAMVYGIVASWGEPNMLIAASKLAWFKLTHGFWFLHAYAVMMCLAAVVNVAQGAEGLLPMLAVVWIWGFGRTLPIVGDLLPRTPGLDAYGGITLFGIYLAARWVWMSGIVERVKAWHLAVAIPLLWFATGVGLGDYNSPFAFALAMCVFVAFRRIGLFVSNLHLHLPSTPFKVAVSWLGPSMFSVYLLHTNEVGFPLLARLDGEIGVVGAALVVFVGCVLLDLPRRIVGVLWKRR